MGLTVCGCYFDADVRVVGFVALLLVVGRGVLLRLGVVDVAVKGQDWNIKDT